MGEYTQPLSPLNLHTEEEPQEHSIRDKCAFEELCDEEEEEENHSSHDESASGEKNDEDEEEEQFVPSQNTPEEVYEEERGEEEVTQEIAEQDRVSTPEQPDQQNNEEAPQAKNQEIGQGESPSPSAQTVVPSNKTEEIKILRKEQQRLLNVIVQFRQQIRILKMGKREKRTLVVRHETTPVKPLRKKVKRT